MMFWQACAVTRDRLLAEDVLQESLLRLLPHYETLVKLAQPQLASYVNRTVRYTAIAIMRKRNKDWDYYGENGLEGLADQDAPAPEVYVIRKEYRKDMVAALKQLPERYRDLLCLKYYYHRSNAELAAFFGTSEANIRQMLTRGRRRLRALYGGGRDET